MSLHFYLLLFLKECSIYGKEFFKDFRTLLRFYLIISKKKKTLETLSHEKDL